MYWNDTNIGPVYPPILININMRCIEIMIIEIQRNFVYMININMRCIEMQAQRILDNPLARLTLTWDVLK